jgi:hypothetical protein
MMLKMMEDKELTKTALRKGAIIFVSFLFVHFHIAEEFPLSQLVSTETHKQKKNKNRNLRFDTGV